MTSQEFEGTGGAPGADEVAGYAAEVRAQFADLPEAESAELLEDLEDHLREVAAEGAGTLRERLGAPAEYASELRQAAGLPEPGEGSGSGASQKAGAVPWWRVMRASARNVLAEADRRIRVNPAGVAVLDFLPSLRPAWWVLRAWVVVRLLQVTTTYVDTWHEFSLIPRVNYSTLVGTLCLLVAIPASVYLGRRNFQGGWPGRAMLTGQTLLVVFTIGMALSAIQDENDDGNTSDWRSASQQMAGPVMDGLVDDGKSITNLYLYDQNGRSLSDVLVYDQDGQPVRAQQGPTKEAIAANTWRDDNGAFISNVFPRQILGVQWNPADGIENYVAVPPPSVTVPPGVHRVLASGLPQDSATPPSNTSNTSSSPSPSTPASSGASGAQSSSALPPTPTPSGSKG